MSCYGCGTSFGTFKKEHGCKNCGMSFCTKCLVGKVSIPKMNNEKHRVCMKCYNIMTGKVKPKEDPARYSPPENFKKRVAALHEREAAEKSGPGPSHRLAQGGGGRGKNVPYKGMSKADFEIQQRLEKLKEKTPKEIEAAKVTAGEIDNRLARLKGMDPERYKQANKPTYHPPDRRTQQEQMNDLLDEIGNEVELDSRLPDPATEIADRLARLREKPDTGKKDQDDANENNLNKPSMRDSQTFVQNISDNTTNTKTSNISTNTTTTTTTTNVPLDPTGNQSSQGAPQEGAGGSEDPVSAEEVRRILSEAAQELELDAQKALKGLQEDKEIMKKLQDIKQRRKESTTDINRDEKLEESCSENEEEDDEAMTAALIKQALEEAKLDEAAAKDGIDIDTKPKHKAKDWMDTKTKPKHKAKLAAKKSNEKMVVKKNDDDDDEWYDPDELPYCCICTEDAAVRCLDCDRDLYCSKCFSDGHKELGLTGHRSFKYIPPKGST